MHHEMLTLTRALLVVLPESAVIVHLGIIGNVIYIVWGSIHSVWSRGGGGGGYMRFVQTIYFTNYFLYTWQSFELIKSLKNVSQSLGGGHLYCFIFNDVT